MRLIDADALAKVKFHGYPEIEITPSDVNAEAYKRGWNDAIDAIIESAPTVDAVPQWIPRSERLPEPDDRVLVYTAGKEFHVWDAMPHRAESYAWEDEEGLYHSLYEVDLWMPLPEPYKAERKEE